MKVLLQAIFLTVIINFVYAQKVEDVVQKVRGRYYRITGVDVSLDKISYKGIYYFFENEKLSIAKEETSSGRFEYYYDHDKLRGYYPYFIYFESIISSKPNLRAYYDDEAILVLYKENDKETEITLSNNRYYELKLNAFNVVNTFFNLAELARYPGEQRTQAILEKVKNLEGKIEKVDTLDYYDRGNVEGGEYHYFSTEGKLVITEKFSTSEHNSSINTKYYDESTFGEPELLYSTYEEEVWVANLSDAECTITFYENGEAFRTEEYDSHGVFSAGEGTKKYYTKFVNLEKMVPRIKYVEK